MTRSRIYISVLFCLLLLPSCVEKPLHNANWYYYWEKDNVIPVLDRNGSPASRWDWSVQGVNSTTWGASHPPSNGYVLTDYCIDACERPVIWVQHRTRGTWEDIGAATTYAIEKATATAHHEIQHQTNWDFIQAGNADTDADGLADNQEGFAPYWFTVGDRDTWQCATFISASYATYGDNEVIARETEPAGVATVNLNEDWSAGGAQWDQ